MVCGAGEDLGTVEVGKLADLVVLDRNLFAHPTEEIHAARVQLTLVEGERVFAADDNIRHSTRSTDFIAPRSKQEMRFRDAALSLARSAPFAQRMIARPNAVQSR